MINQARQTLCLGQTARILYIYAEWVAGIAQGLNVVKVSVADVRVEHAVKLMDFTWLGRGQAPYSVGSAYLWLPVSSGLG
jgi:hypothetical protein